MDTEGTASLYPFVVNRDKPCAKGKTTGTPIVLSGTAHENVYLHSNRHDMLRSSETWNIARSEKLFLFPAFVLQAITFYHGNFLDGFTLSDTFFVTIESMPDEDAGIEIELLDTEFFFDPELDTMHMTAAAWSWLSNTDGQIRVNVHPNFFGTDIDVINYTISMEVTE